MKHSAFSLTILLCLFAVSLFSQKPTATVVDSVKTETVTPGQSVDYDVVVQDSVIYLVTTSVTKQAVTLPQLQQSLMQSNQTIQQLEAQLTQARGLRDQFVLIMGKVDAAQREIAKRKKPVKK